jgi:hypothetical protein
VHKEKYIPIVLDELATRKEVTYRTAHYRKKHGVFSSAHLGTIKQRGEKKLI